MRGALHGFRVPVLIFGEPSQNCKYCITASFVFLGLAVKQIIKFMLFGNDFDKYIFQYFVLAQFCNLYINVNSYSFLKHNASCLK